MRLWIPGASARIGDELQAGADPYLVSEGHVVAEIGHRARVRIGAVEALP